MYGRDNHRISDCRIEKSNIKCNLCGDQGHCTKVCFTKLMKSNEGKSKSEPINTVEIDCTSSASPIYGLSKLLTIEHLYEVIDSNKYIVNGKNQAFEVDWLCTVFYRKVIFVNLI